MQYQGLTFTDDLHIEELFSLHYFEYMSTFSFPGESHDFWEFICVDKGEVTIGADEAVHTLKRGQIAFHKPNEFHWVRANGNVAPNLIVISFSCRSPMMDFFRDKILNVEEAERRILAQDDHGGRELSGRAPGRSVSDNAESQKERLPGFRTAHPHLSGAASDQPLPALQRHLRQSAEGI